MRDELIEAWDDGKGDGEQANMCAKVISLHIRNDREAARFPLPIIFKVADGPCPYPRPT
jgi:hypothetical protein